MDRELWKRVFDAIKQADRAIGWNGGRRRPLYANWLIVAMYLWCVWHDRPLCWGCDRSHYHALFRPRRPTSAHVGPRRLPSISQFTRRIKSRDCERILQRVHDELAQRGLLTEEGYLDGKPLLVSPVSKDREARRGRVCGGFAKGYKLHAFVNEDRRIVVWSVTSLNQDEKVVAEQLLAYLPPMSLQAVVLCDSNYDSAPLQQASERMRPDVRLITPLRGENQVGPDGRSKRKLRQMGRRRRELLLAWERSPRLLRLVMQARLTIDRCFGVLCCAGGLLGTALPPWVRTLSRVTRWIGAKIILYNARLTLQERLVKTAVA